MSEYEPTQIIVDTVTLTGPENELTSQSAVNKSYVDSHVAVAISNLVDNAPEALNTLKEIATALTTSNGDMAGSLVAQINAVNFAITAEASNRATSDATQNANFLNEQTLRDVYREEDRNARSSEIADLNFLLQEESQSRVATDNEHLRYIQDEVGFRESERVDYLQKFVDEAKTRDDNINAEASTRLMSDNDLRAYIDAEVNERLTQKEIFLQYRREDIDARQQADALKFDKTGGDVSGDVVLFSYLYFGPSWRVKASNDGSRIVYEFKKNNVWKMALPFICKN